MRSILLSLTLSLALCLPAQGCKDLGSTLTKVNAGVTTINTILAGIEHLLGERGIHDPAIDAALQSVRETGNAALALADGVRDVHDGKFLDAANKFQAAWTSLVAALAPYGIRPDPTGVLFAARSGGGMSIPDAARARRMLEGEL